MSGLFTGLVSGADLNGPAYTDKAGRGHDIGAHLGEACQKLVPSPFFKAQRKADGLFGFGARLHLKALYLQDISLITRSAFPIEEPLSGTTIASINGWRKGYPDLLETRSPQNLNGR